MELDRSESLRTSVVHLDLGVLDVTALSEALLQVLPVHREGQLQKLEYDLFGGSLGKGFEQFLPVAGPLLFKKPACIKRLLGLNYV